MTRLLVALVVASCHTCSGSDWSYWSYEDPSSTCRNDICGDIADDCCAPGDETRVCTLPGYMTVDAETYAGWGIDR